MEDTDLRLRAMAILSTPVSLLSDRSSTHTKGAARVGMKLDFIRPKSRTPQRRGSAHAKRHDLQTWDTGIISSMLNSLKIFTSASSSRSSHLLHDVLISPILAGLWFSQKALRDEIWVRWWGLHSLEREGEKKR